MDDAVEFLMELAGGRQLSFEDIELLVDYVDARLGKKVSRQDKARLNGYRKARIS